jgi:D-lyxose ketol-isomerase
MYARRGMTTPAHCHHRKKEDIVSRWGTLQATVWAGVPGTKEGNSEVLLKINGEKKTAPSASKIVLNPGERITLMPGVYHEFCPLSEECIIGEISTANDDLHDNFFVNPDIGRFPALRKMNRHWFSWSANAVRPPDPGRTHAG